MKIYAARDANGKLYVYFNHKPIKRALFWCCMGVYCETVEDLPSIKWEDDEPTEVFYDENDSNKLKIK